MLKLSPEGFMRTLLHNLEQTFKTGHPALHQMAVLKQNPSAVPRKPCEASNDFRRQIRHLSLHEL